MNQYREDFIDFDKPKSCNKRGKQLLREMEWNGRNWSVLYVIKKMKLQNNLAYSNLALCFL